MGIRHGGGELVGHQPGALGAVLHTRAHEEQAGKHCEQDGKELAYHFVYTPLGTNSS